MFNPFYNYISPDQGYYTQQPATVDQVNNIWHFVQKMRGELFKTIQEFNKYPDRQEEIAQNVQSITDQLKLVQQQFEKLRGADEKASVAIDELEAYLEAVLEEHNKLLMERLKDVSIITPESGSVLPVKKITGTDDEYTKQITFTSTEDEAAVDTNITGSKDVVNITQTVPGLLSENLAPRFTVGNVEDGFTTKIDDKPILKLESETLDGDLVAPHIENINEGEYRLTVSSDSVKSEIARIDEATDEVKSRALSRDVELSLNSSDKPEDFGVYATLRSVDGSFERKIGLKIDCDTSFLEAGLDLTDDIFRLVLYPLDQFKRSYPIHNVSNTTIDGLTITTSKSQHSYDTDELKVKISEPFDTKKLSFTTTPDDKHTTYFEVDQAGNVTINTEHIENTAKTAKAVITARIDTLQSRIVELEEKVRRLETRAVNQITSSNIRVEPRQNDKLAIILENYYANGKHEEKQAVINFTNQDGALIFHTRDQGISGQTEMFINMNNEWLNKQGLSSTISA